MTVGSLGTPPLRKDFQLWSAISATPNDFLLNDGVFGLTLKATWGAGNAVIQQLLPDGSYVPVSVAFTLDSYVEIELPAGQYQLTITSVTGLTGKIAKLRRER
jgi:hypothetical protein